MRVLWDSAVLWDDDSDWLWCSFLTKEAIDLISNSTSAVDEEERPSLPSGARADALVAGLQFDDAEPGPMLWYVWSSADSDSWWLSHRLWLYRPWEHPGLTQLWDSGQISRVWKESEK